MNISANGYNNITIKIKDIKRYTLSFSVSLYRVRPSERLNNSGKYL
jgi:hypothetical protein